MNIDSSDDRSVGLQGNNEPPSCNPDVDDNVSDSEESRFIEQETFAMFDDFSFSGGPLRDGMSITTTSSNNSTGEAPGDSRVSASSTLTNRRHQLSAICDIVPGKKAKVATQSSDDVANSPHFHLPPTLAPKSDSANRLKVLPLSDVGWEGNDSASIPSPASLPLEFFRHAETLYNWEDCIATMNQLLSSEDGVKVEYLKPSWELLQTVPHLSCIIGNKYLTTIKNMTFERCDAQSQIALLQSHIAFLQSHTALVQALSCMKNVCKTLIYVNGILKSMAGLSQSEPSMRSKLASETCSSVSPHEKGDVDSLDRNRLKTEEDKRPRNIDRLTSLGKRSLTSLDDLGMYKDCVYMFNARYQAMLGDALRKSEYLDSSGALTYSDRHESLKNITSALMGRPSSILDAEQLASVAARFIPAPQSHEVDAVQPYLASFLRAIGNCLDDNQFQQQAKSDKTGISDETPIKHVLENRPRRYVRGHEHARIADGSMAVDGRFISLLRDDAMEICVEMKSEITPSRADPIFQIHVACDQIYSHLARHLGVLFDFCGAGMDGKATGIVVMPCCVKIIQLCLTNMGTKEVTLVGSESDPLPLMTEENFDLWARREQRSQEKLSNLKSVLYPSVAERENIPPTHSANHNNKIPSGIVALAALLVSKRSDLFGAGNIENDSLGTLLGQGSFSCIYTHKNNANSVVKVSRYGANRELKREAGILKALNKSMDNSIGLVRLLSDEDLLVKIGGVDRMLCANILSPRGVPIERALPSDLEERRLHLLVCGGVLKSALDFLHRQHYTHNDVTPNNIMYKIVGPGHPGHPGQPFFVDLGLSTKMGTKDLRKFQGTPRYAHSDIFQKNRSSVCWCGRPKYDFAGLAFSIATLLSVNTRRPWSQFQPVNTFRTGSDKGRLRWMQFVKWVEIRSNTAQTLLLDANFDQEWQNWCNDKISGRDGNDA